MSDPERSARMKTLVPMLLLSLCACSAPSVDAPTWRAEPAFDVSAWQPYSSYLAHVIEAVQKKWERILLESRVYPGSGKEVAVRFRLGAERGEVIEILEVTGSADALGKKSCVAAIASAAPYGAWSAQMKDDFGESRELTFRFFFQ